MNTDWNVSDMSEPERGARLSRQEIEVLCILHAVGSGCALDELVVRLGFPGQLAEVVAEAIEPLIAAGELTADGGMVGVTAAGRAHLSARLSFIEDLQSDSRA